MKTWMAILALVSFLGGARAENPVVVIDTTMGVIKVELFEKEAPGTVKNFLGYVDEKFYDGTIFHRVMGRENSQDDFMIQGGGHEPGMKEKKSKEPIQNESANGLKNQRGTMAMARKPAPHSATSQFFINVVDNPRLDADRAEDKFGYCVFGKVIDGMSVVDKIKAVRTTSRNGHNNVPVDDILIKSIIREKK